ncbi:MAG TPA: hypothetical protein VES60_16095 [Nakamurella sp.]|nr:hypothetical protein [Nakamurella sp.]
MPSLTTVRIVDIAETSGNWSVRRIRRALRCGERIDERPKSVAQKLLITPGGTLWLSHPVRVDLLEPLPENVRLVSGPDQAQIAVVFADGAGGR